MSYVVCYHLAKFELKILLRMEKQKIQIVLAN
jgi:hypothetical protein